MSPPSAVRLGALIAATCLSLAGCGNQNDTAAQVTQVQVAIAQPAAAQAAAPFSGTVVPRVESQLAFRVPGRIVERQADVGSRVAKGDVLARLDDTPFKLAVEEAEARLAEAKATSARVRRDVERNRRLAETGAIAGADFDALQTQHANAQSQVRAAQSLLDRARNDLSYTRLTAAADGSVALVQAEPGQVVDAGTPVLRLARAGENEVQVDIPENQISHIALKQSAKVRLLSLPQAQLTGTVREVSSVADPQTRTYRVRVALSELPVEARLGMTASISFNRSPGAAHVRLPLTALFQQGEQTAVWVLPDEAKQLVLRPVSLANMGTDTITVAEGIAPGERVVVAGVHRLDASMAVQAWDTRLP